MPIMTSLSTRFLGHPSDIKPTLGIQGEWRLYANPPILACPVPRQCIWTLETPQGPPTADGGRYKGKKVHPSFVRAGTEGGRYVEERICSGRARRRKGWQLLPRKRGSA